MTVALNTLINLQAHPLAGAEFIDACRQQLDRRGVVALPGFLRPQILEQLVQEAAAAEPQAYFTASTHNVYLTPPDPGLPGDHIFNRQVVSTKGCICDDMVGQDSPLRLLYNHPVFQDFVSQVVGVTALYPYADPLSSLNIHYAPAGKELGWHFDNSEFAITLLLQAPEAGGAYQYIKDLRDADAGEMNFKGVEAALDGTLPATTLPIDPGTLVLFRGRNSLHRVTPTIGSKTRYLVVLAYNGQPGISLSETARQTFYGRIGTV